MFRQVLATATVLMVAAHVVRTQSVPVPASPQLETFLTQLQTASQSGNREAIASMIRYPITIAIFGLRVPFGDAASVVARYDDIFNPALRDVIARASVRAEGGTHQVTASGGGYVIGAGDIVITPFEGRLLISSIAVPLFDGGDSAATPPVETSAGTAVKHEPRRIAIRVGARPTQIPGLLARAATDSYLLYLPKGQLAGVRLERVPAGAAVIRVVHARTGTPLSARLSADGRFVTGRPPEGADYRIEVRRTDNADEAALPYMLSLTLR